MLTQLLTLLLLLPVFGFIGCLLIPRARERAIFTVAITILAIEFLIVAMLTVAWIASGAAPFTVHLGTLFSSPTYTFAVELLFDATAAVFLAMTALMTTLISIFSKYYLHREQGFKRFYVTIFLFLTGLSLILLAGNFEVLFVGWELIGISSVLLIAFYRDRYLPARNALKVFSVYRIGDAFLLAALLYAHHVFHASLPFVELSSAAAEHTGQIVLLGLLLLIVAMVKSAQFPFSYWLPRAMEGPTTSSAIFYGALSVHMGLFLLLRTYPLWEANVVLHTAVGLSGLVTAIVATSIARVQSSAKTQIAYSSIAQIGIMFIELALGLYWLVLIHFVCNAALRAYQLLISPSIVGYLVHDQFFYFTPPIHKIKHTLLGKLYGTFYILGIKEWNMNAAMRKYLWGPLKSLGRRLAILDTAAAQTSLLIVLLVAVGASFFGLLSQNASVAVAAACAAISCLVYIRAYSTKRSARVAWNLLGLGHLYAMLFLAAMLNGWLYLALYGAGIVTAYVLGHVCLYAVRQQGESDTLVDYHGIVYTHPYIANITFVAVLLFMAFPISPSFLAQEALLSMIPGSYAPLIVLFCIAYLVMGVAAMRLYMKVFFGMHHTSRHEKAFRSS